MSNVFDNMKTRRSIRKYKPDLVPENLIDKIMEAGSYAATGKNWQSPIIIAVSNPLLRSVCLLTLKHLILLTFPRISDIILARVSIK